MDAVLLLQSLVLHAQAALVQVVHHQQGTDFSRVSSAVSDALSLLVYIRVYFIDRSDRLDCHVLSAMITNVQYFCSVIEAYVECMDTCAAWITDPRYTEYIESVRALAAHVSEHPIDGCANCRARMDHYTLCYGQLLELYNEPIRYTALN
jgi:hypothetical protein